MDLYHGYIIIISYMLKKQHNLNPRGSYVAKILSEGRELDFHQWDLAAVVHEWTRSPWFQHQWTHRKIHFLPRNCCEKTQKHTGMLIMKLWFSSEAGVDSTFTEVGRNIFEYLSSSFADWFWNTRMGEWNQFHVWFGQPLLWGDGRFSRRVFTWVERCFNWLIKIL